MPDAPWMSSMLGQLLDAIESDPALLARIRRLLAPPVMASTAAPESVQTPVVATSTTTDPVAVGSSGTANPPPDTASAGVPAVTAAVAASAAASTPALSISSIETTTSPSSTVAAAICGDTPVGLTPASAPSPQPLSAGTQSFTLPWVSGFAPPLVMPESRPRALARALQAGLSARVEERAYGCFPARQPVLAQAEAPTAGPAKTSLPVNATPPAAKTSPAPASADKLAELQQRGIGAKAHGSGSGLILPKSLRELQRLPLALSDASIVAGELASGRPHPGLGCEWLREITASRQALEDLAEAYRVAALAPDLLLNRPGNRASLSRLLQAIGTVQAWLYGRIAVLGGNCLWQTRLHDALTEAAHDCQVFVKRHLRLSDPPSRAEFVQAAAQLRALDEVPMQVLAPTTASPSPAATVQRAVAAETQRVLPLLAGRTVLLIGGECRPERQETLQRDFGLKELRWLGTREHAPIEPLLKAVADPDVSLVLLLIRLSSHSYGEVAEPCRQRGIPLVRIPGGYGTNQLAHQILEQAGERLGALPPAA